MITNKQKLALEKITGKEWGSFSPSAVDAFFSLTDRGVKQECNEPDYFELLEAHHWHSVTVELWREDFKSGLLSLWDFLQPDYPESYVKHAFEIYESAMGYIPRCYREHTLGG